MAYASPYKSFIFESYSFDEKTYIAEFRYSFDGERRFIEKLKLSKQRQAQSINTDALEQALQLAFYVAGTSYYKAFPTKEIVFNVAQPNLWQAEFLNKVYQEGLSQFYFENDFELSELPTFFGSSEEKQIGSYKGRGAVVLQSGGKDSLLLASLLTQKNITFSPWYIKYGNSHPDVLDQLDEPLQTVERVIDKVALESAAEAGALNGHVPVTYIVMSYALIDAILQGKNSVLAAIGAEGAEAHAYIGEMPVNHQWAKTWEAEQLLSQYVNRYIAPEFQIGSPLRGFSELRIAELFVENAWEKFGHSFSSCNRANYQQGADNTTLRWCGECPKCANSYLLFAPFVAPEELQALFGGQDLFKNPALTETFKGLLAINGVMKPFECVGETEELRIAYHMARENYGHEAYQLPFDVPNADFDYQVIRPHNLLVEL